MKRKLIPISEIDRKEAARYAQYLMDGDAVAWIYILTGYFEFCYLDYEYPEAVLPAVDGYFRVRDTTPLVRALMRFTIEGKHGWIYPAELVDENGELFNVILLDEVRYGEYKHASYVVYEEDNVVVVGFPPAQFSLEMVNQVEHPAGHPKQQPASEPSGLLRGVRKGSCNIAILTYLQKCAAANEKPTAQMCWESAKENANDYNQNWMLFPKIRFPNEDTKKIYRESFDQRYTKILANFTRPG